MFDVNLGNLSRQRAGVESRSISAENPTGGRGMGAMEEPKGEGAARELGRGWKVRPCITLKKGETITIMDTEGPGVIRHIWMTFHPKMYRDVILRVYWDGQEHPSIQAPVGDFFCNSWKTRQNVLSQPMNVNPMGGMNCYFPMPFRKNARITVENIGPEDFDGFFYTINYTLEPVEVDALYFHAYWRRTNPLPYKQEYLIIDGIKGAGHYVGTFMSWQQNSEGWWGEGEIKMFLDGDEEFPTICGTGTEDYFGGAWCFGTGAEGNFSAPYLGFQQVAGVNGHTGCRMTLYRFHVLDPVFFGKDLKVTMQALGWRDQGRYLALQDDISSVAYWYQTFPHAPFEPMPGRDELEII